MLGQIDGNQQGALQNQKALYLFPGLPNLVFGIGFDPARQKLSTGLRHFPEDNDRLNIDPPSEPRRNCLKG